jgi:hypothetical protein
MMPDNRPAPAEKHFPTAEEMSDIAFWQRLLPEESIGERPFRASKTDIRFSADQAGLLSRQIRKEGYFQSTPVIPGAETAALTRAIARLDAARVLPVFVAMYDRYWQFLHSLRNTLNPILGDGYRLSPDFWAWHVTPGPSRRGWVFHRDADISRPFDAHAHLHEDGRPRLCNIWIPLTDATTHNSCIYVLPFPHDPAIQSFLQKQSMQTIQQQAQLTNWTNVRALPAQAGSVLGWSPYIIHWGSQSTEWATQARVSLGIYYESADSPMVGRPFDSEGRRYIGLHDEDFRISFEDRLRIIANILAIYGEGVQMANEPNYSPAVITFSQRWRHHLK